MTGQPVQSIPVEAITVLNPRSRNKKVFGELIKSIAHLGLKRPITVTTGDAASTYRLVCGQGRLEAFIALGQSTIPAVVVEASEHDCFVMSLVENVARRHHTPMELLASIANLRERGYSATEIARKTDLSDEYISAIGYLLDHGEHRLLAGVERGIVPPSIAMEIARAQDSDVQNALTEAYERKSLPGNQVLAIRRIVEQRNLSGKGQVHGGNTKGKRPVTADVLVRAYRRETERQKLVVKKAAITQSRLLFIVNGLRRLLADDHFVTLLRAERLATMPEPLAERVTGGGR